MAPVSIDERGDERRIGMDGYHAGSGDFQRLQAIIEIATTDSGDETKWLYSL